MNRRQVLRGVGMGALGAALAVGLPAMARADDGVPDSPDIEGAWHVTVRVTSPAPATFDTLYLFARGGAFARVDGRSPKIPTALGSWRRHGDSVEFSYLLFSFDPTTGARVGTVAVPSTGRIENGQLTGTFVANGIATDPSGVPTGGSLPGFPKAGTTDGTRVATNQA